MFDSCERMIGIRIGPAHSLMMTHPHRERSAYPVNCIAQSSRCFSVISGLQTPSALFRLGSVNVKASSAGAYLAFSYFIHDFTCTTCGLTLFGKPLLVWARLICYVPNKYNSSHIYINLFIFQSFSAVHLSTNPLIPHLSDQDKEELSKDISDIIRKQWNETVRKSAYKFLLLVRASKSKEWFWSAHVQKQFRQRVMLLIKLTF